MKQNPAWLGYAYEVRERIDRFCSGESAREKYELRIHFSFLTAVESHAYGGMEKDWKYLIAQLGNFSATQEDVERIVSAQLGIKRSTVTTVAQVAIWA